MSLLSQAPLPLKDILRQAEQDWPFPLAATCRALWVKSHWEDALGVAQHLFELVLRHAYTLVLVEYRQLPYPSERLAQYLMHKAYRGRATCGSMIEGLREIVPYLAGYQDLLIMPDLIAALAPEGQFETLDQAVLSPLNAWRVQWSHPKGHVAYTAPRVADYEDFSQKLTVLLHRLRCFGDYTLLFTQQLTRQASGWQQSALRLQGAMQPFETVNYQLPLDQTPPESHAVVLACAGQARLWPLAPFYMGRSDASGHCELSTLSALRKKRCLWDPEWPADTEGAAHNAYVHWMESFTLPERPVELSADLPADASTDLPTEPSTALEAAPARPPLEPTFRNATWRMFAMDWDLEVLELENHAHYDALLHRQQVLAVWRYVPEENAYLLGVRPRLLASSGDPWVLDRVHSVHTRLEQCPVDYQKDFAPEHGGHWHHSHYQWAYVPNQDVLGAYLEACDTLCRNPKGRL